MRGDLDKGGPNISTIGNVAIDGSTDMGSTIITGLELGMKQQIMMLIYLKGMD